MQKITILHLIRASQAIRRILLGLVLVLLFVQWNVLQHVETHLSGHDSDNCQVCLLGYHMASAISYIPPSIPIVPVLASESVVTQSKLFSSPVISFLARAPPLS